jgi:hypothetical protein
MDSRQEIGNHDPSDCTALLVNPLRTTCWTLYHVFPDEELLTKVRQAIGAEIFRGDTVKRWHIHRQTLNSSLFLEFLVRGVLRIQSNNVSTRILLEEVTVDDVTGSSSLLKDPVLVMPSVLIHSSKAVSGEPANYLQPKGFLDSNISQPCGSAYLSFGGGIAFCPRRIFRYVRSAALSVS